MSSKTDSANLNWIKPAARTRPPMLILSEGDSARIRIVSEPYAFVNEFTGRTGQTVRTDSYAFVIIHRRVTDGKPDSVLMTATFSLSVYEQLFDLAQKYGNPAHYDVLLTHIGKSQWTVQGPVGSIGPWSGKIQALIEANPIDLKSLFGPKTADLTNVGTDEYDIFVEE